MKRSPQLRGRRSKSAPCIALLTDFGLGDHFVGSMKGVLASMCPQARVVDISHDVTPHHVVEAGYLLWASYSYFPVSTLFVAIVDPGVGTDRKILFVKSPRSAFLAPDNGLLDFVLAEEQSTAVFEIQDREQRRYGLPAVSSTFHGRDLFAPLAAHVALGRVGLRIGRRIHPPKPPEKFIWKNGGVVRPTILHIDHFGNIVSNVRAQSFEDISHSLTMVTVGRTMISRWVPTFDAAPSATPCLTLGSSNLVEVILKNGSAASLLGATLESPVRLFWQE